MQRMKQLLMVAVAALLSLSGLVRAQGPDDTYIGIYKMIQEADQLAAAGQSAFARERYRAAEADLKKLKTNYPNWNQQLIEYRLRTLEEKLAGAQPAPPSTTPPARPGTVPATPTPAAEAPAPAPRPLPSAPAITQAEVDDRDRQIKALQEQLARMQNDRAILEAKLREALAARPAALDPRELARAEERIRSLEKDREVLRVSAELAEAKVREGGVAELKQALEQARQNMAQQQESITALRQEKELLQHRLLTVTRADEEAVKTLRAENQTLKQQLAQRPAEGTAGNERMEKELESTRAALQSSRESMNSLQARVRTLQDERDRLDNLRRDLETRLAAAASAQPPPAAPESPRITQLQRERDELQRQLNDANRQLADSRSRAQSAPARTQSSDEVAGLRARLDVLEARRIPYTPEELALFKKPEQPAAVTTVATTPASQPPRDLPAGVAPLLAEAQRAFSARRFDEAEKKYTEVLEVDNRNVAALQRLAAAQLEQNRPQDAAANLQKALQESPKDARSLLLMGIAMFDQQKFDEAFDHLSRSAQVDSQNAETQNYLGITLSHKGQRAAAETALRKAIQLAPNYASAHYNLAIVYATQNPPFTELARWHYQKALAYGHPQNNEVEKMLERKQAASQN